MSRKVQEVLRHVWSGSSANQLPNAVECYRVAVAVKVVAGTKYVRGLQEEQKPKTTRLEAAGKEFLKELQNDRDRILAELADCPLEAEYFYKPALDHIAATWQAVTEELESRKSRPLNSAQLIAQPLAEAFTRAGLPEPQGKNREGKLCSAVKRLLELGGVNYSQDSVSEMLRGTWERPPESGGQWARNSRECAHPRRRLATNLP